MFHLVFARVADPECLSRILIFIHPGFHIFFCDHKIELFYFELVKKQIWVNLQRSIERFTQKIVIKLSRND
jgi:hypothetical protein